MFYEKIRKIIRVVIKGMCFIPLVACVSGGKFNYVASEELGYDPLYMLNESDMKKPKDYGALKYQQDDMEIDEGNLYILQKTKGIYQAETMFKQSDNKRYYFSFGLNYKKKMPHVGFRLEF